MKKYIERGAARTALLKYYGLDNVTKENCWGEGDTLMYYEVRDMIEDVLDNLPAAPVIPIGWIESQVDKGKWAELVQRWKETQP